MLFCYCCCFKRPEWSYQVGFLEHANNKEPHKALLANPKTKFYEEIFKDADKIMNKNSILAFEIGEDMEDEISALVEYYFPNSAYKLANDMYGKLRFLYIMIKEDGNYA